MRKWYFLFLLISQVCISQKNKLAVNELKLKTSTIIKTKFFKVDCESGEKTAKIDFEKGIYEVFFF